MKDLLLVNLLKANCLILLARIKNRLHKEAMWDMYLDAKSIDELAEVLLEIKNVLDEQ